MEAASIPWRPIGRVLVEQGLLSHLQLETALTVQELTGRRLGEILVERGYVSVAALAGALADQLGIELAPEADAVLPRPVLRVVHPDDEPEVLEPEPPVPTLDDHRASLAEAQLAVARRDLRIAELENYLARIGGRVPPSPRVAPSHVLFVPAGHGYALVERDGPPPPRGSSFVLDGAPVTVTRIGRSPLPDDPRRCAYLQPG